MVDSLDLDAKTLSNSSLHSLMNTGAFGLDNQRHSFEAAI